MKLLPICFSVYVIILSSIFLPLYVNDDQYLYRLFYESLEDLSLEDGYLSYQTIVGASEPLYFILVFLFNSLFKKDMLFTVVNCIFGYQLAALICRYKKEYLLLFAATNFYIVALLFSHERLKLAVLFMLIADNLGSTKYYYLGIASHFQIIILSGSSALLKIINSKKNFIYNILNYKFFILIFFSFIGFFYFKESIQEKFIYYYQSAESDYYGKAISIIKVIIFMVVGYSYTNNKNIIIIPNLIIIFSIFLIGGDRLVIFSYGCMMYCYLNYFNNSQERKIPYLIILINLYMSFKGIYFLNNIIDHGHGFG